ncbi:MAG: HEPN domain-containing protein [Paludibacteraceae bacterium]|nr:HEPN domain-containing protein [Paludibacteraceae bacterium]
MSLSYDERNAIVQLRLERAYQTLEEAKGNMTMKYWHVVANRLYYAAYYAVSALLIANGDTAQTQSARRSFLECILSRQILSRVR